MWKLHTAVVAIAGMALILGLSGSQLIAGIAAGPLKLADLDIWLQGGLSYPTLWAFGLGVLAAHGIIGLWLLGKTFRADPLAGAADRPLGRGRGDPRRWLCARHRQPGHRMGRAALYRLA